MICSKGKIELCLCWLSLDLLKKDWWDVACAHPPKAVPRLNQEASTYQSGNLCVQSTSSSNSVSVGFERIFCLHICTPSPFFKGEFKPTCPQEQEQNEESKKYSL